MIENNTGARDDWELSCGQYDYLHDERLYRRFIKAIMRIASFVGIR